VYDRDNDTLFSKVLGATPASEQERNKY